MNDILAMGGLPTQRRSPRQIQNKAASMIATPTAGQSIDNDSGDAWLVHSVTRTLASTVVRLSPLRRDAGPAGGERRFELSLSDFRIFCTFSGIRDRSGAPGTNGPPGDIGSARGLTEATLTGAQIDAHDG